jgi:DNA-directed RNA polymerase specialized sigma24 family protein
MAEADIAAALGCSVGTVKSQTHDALARLRRLVPSAIDSRVPDSQAGVTAR